MPLIEAVAERKSGERVNVLTHCNAGWLATVDVGTATAPIYLAHDRGLPVHVVAKVLGHKDATITLRVYAHVLADMQQDAANQIDAMFGT